jgi:hypothetical protein
MQIKKQVIYRFLTVTSVVVSILQAKTIRLFLNINLLFLQTVSGMPVIDVTKIFQRLSSCIQLGNQGFPINQIFFSFSCIFFFFLIIIGNNDKIDTKYSFSNNLSFQMINEESIKTFYSRLVGIFHPFVNSSQNIFPKY